MLVRRKIATAPDRDIPPLGIAADRARSPDDDAAPGHGANHIHPDRVELVLLGVAHGRGNGNCPRHACLQFPQAL